MSEAALSSKDPGVEDTQEDATAFSRLSATKKIILVAILCLAQFLDTFANSSLFAAIPPISIQLGISNSNSVWLISGYQLTFAALLLGSGRMSDLYNPKYVFLVGATSITGFSLGAGFAQGQVLLFILRALAGVGAALTVPSALYMIIHMFPDPKQQSQAVALFGGCGAIGNVLGLIIGAFIVNWATWPWIFYVIAITAGIVFIVVAFLSPSPQRKQSPVLSGVERFKRLDLFGVSLVTGKFNPFHRRGLVLLIFGVTSGSVNGWGSARCLAPFIISFFLLAVFFVWEARIPEEIAAIPPSLWKVKNFSVLVGSATLPYMWWAVVQLMFSWIWQNVYGWSPINTAVHFLPLGLLAFPMTIVSSLLQQKFPLKWVLVFGQFLTLIGTILLTFGDFPQHYWPLVFPGFLLGTSGMAIAYVTVNIAIFAATPPEKAGVVGSIFNCFQQVGGAAGTAIVTSIQTSVDANHGGPTVWIGRRAGLWFEFGLLAVSTICIMIFMRLENELPVTKNAGSDMDIHIEMEGDTQEKRTSIDKLDD